MNKENMRDRSSIPSMEVQAPGCVRLLNGIERDPPSLPCQKLPRPSAPSIPPPFPCSVPFKGLQAPPSREATPQGMRTKRFRTESAMASAVATVASARAFSRSKTPAPSRPKAIPSRFYRSLGRGKGKPVVFVPIRAAGTSGSDAEPVETTTTTSMTKTLVLGGLFGTWYFFNIFFNIYNKQVLKVYPNPVTCTWIQFTVGGWLASAMWLLKLHPKPQIDKDMLIGILPLAVVHTLGNLLTNVSLGKVAVSFTHTIKAMEPFFSVLLSSVFLGDAPSLPIVLSLLPVVGGVALASATEASFNWAGFISAMGSNITFQSRNVLSKKFMGQKKGSLDNINLFSVITLMSGFLIAPIMFFTEGFTFTPTQLAAAGLNVNEVITRAALAGVFFHAYQQVSYMILQRVTPVTHSVGNCVKRVVVIVSSVLFFRTPVSMLNACGTALALGGVFLYSRVKTLQGKKKA